MLDIRIGVAISAESDKKLVEICQKHAGETKPLSKGDFLMAMITMLPAEVQDRAIEAYKLDRDLRKQAQKQQKKDLERAIKNLSPDQIAKLLAEADKS